MNFIKKSVISVLFLGAFAPTHGMWKSFLTKAALNKKTLFAAAATASAGAGYAKKDELATFKQKSLETLQQKLEDARLDILKQEKLKTFRKIYPTCFQALVTDPLLRKIRYNSLTEYVQESEEATQRRQAIARTLCVAGVPLGVSQTEADMLAYEYNKHKKDFASHYLRTSLDTMIKAEKEISAQDKYILYHAMIPKIYTADYIGTRLQTMLDSDIPQDFLNLRQPQIIVSTKTRYERLLDFIWSTKDQSSDIKAENNMREKLLTRKSYDDNATKNESVDGAKFPADHAFDIRKYLVACSPAILSGQRWASLDALESALTFFPRQHQEGRGFIRDGHYEIVNGIHLQYDTHNIPQNVIQKYRIKLAEAENKFYNKSSSGVMLQMSLSSEVMDKAVYPALPGGPKHNIYTKQSPPQKFEKPSELFAEIRNNPFNVYVKHNDNNCSGIDPLQLRLVVDKSLLLDPNNPEVRDGFKVKAYSANQEALDTFHREVDGIVAEIRSDMQKSENGGQ